MKIEDAQLDVEASAIGTFTGAVDGKAFLVSNFLRFQKVRSGYIIVGNENNKNWIIFTLPRTLQGEGPHDVDCYPGILDWQVKIENVPYRVSLGSVTVTFQNEARTGVKGNVNLFLKGGGKVTGSFNIREQ